MRLGAASSLVLPSIFFFSGLRLEFTGSGRVSRFGFGFRFFVTTRPCSMAFPLCITGFGILW